jgi:hypothetical protein
MRRRWRWSERWCPQQVVQAVAVLAAEHLPVGGRLPGLGRVELGLLRLQVTATVAAGDSLWLADRPHHRDPPGLSRDLGGLRVHAELRLGHRSWSATTPSRCCCAAPAWLGPPGGPEMAPCQARPDRRRPGQPQPHPPGPNRLWVTDSTEHPTHEASSTARWSWTPAPVGWSAGQSTPPRPPGWSPTPSAWPSRPGPHRAEP